MDTAVLHDFAADMRLANYSPNTISSRLDVLARLAADIGTPLLAATPAQLRAHQKRFLPLAPASVNIYTRHIKAFYAWAVHRGHLQHDPAAELIVPKVRRGRPHPTAPDDLRRIFACTTGVLRTAYALAAFAGLRSAEVCAIQRQDLDLQADEPVVHVFGKGGQWRTLPLVPTLVSELHSWGLPRAGHVITHEGRPLQPHRLSNMSTHHLQRLGIPTTLHSMRHYFLTHAARITHDPLFVRDLAGHRSVATTEIYMDSDLHGAHQRLAGIEQLAGHYLGGFCGAPDRLRGLDQPA